MKSTKEILKRAAEAKKLFASVGTEKINKALSLMARALLENEEAILEANERDVMLSREKLGEVMTDRLTLTKERIKKMADGILDIEKLDSPVGKILERTERPNGLVIEKKCVPLGVIAIIYESRPNVTSDAAALAIKSGNTVILRGGKEAYNSSFAIVKALRDALAEAGLPKDALQLVEDTDRSSALELMRARGYVDLLIPRGGKGLISSCVENATVPCLETGTGICHIFVDRTANHGMALDIIENAKKSRPSVCNAAEVCLVHSDIAKEFLPKLWERLSAPERKNPVRIKGTPEVAELIPADEALPEDFDTEFLDYTLAVKTVGSVYEATEHIAVHSTRHSEAIITEDTESAEIFTSAVDSAAVYVNASTRFTDGGEFGLGCEMGISTQKLHARGPVGIKELTSYKYVISGKGQVR